MQPGLEFIAQATNTVSNDWNFVDYAKLIGISLFAVVSTYMIHRARRNEVNQDTAKLNSRSSSSAIETYIAATGS